MLVSRVARKVKDTRLLKLIRRYLNAGIMQDGMVSIRHAGTPQGSPLSPLLSNILLDDFDKELERRGHCFCRYADDVNVYVRSRRAGERVMESLTRFLEGRMRLKVNRTKSAVDRPWKRTFLGYTVTTHFSPRLKPAPASLTRAKDRIRHITHAGRGRLGGHLKTGHRSTLQNRPPHTWRARRSEFYRRPSWERKSVCSLVRQLRGPHLSTCAWWRRRSRSAVTAAVSPRSFPQSSTGLFDVSSVDARS